MKLLRHVPLSGLLLLAGCALVAGPTTPSGSATLSLQPTVQSGGYRTQTVVNAYAQADINHLQVKLFKVVSGSEQAILGTGGSQLMLDLPQASLSAPVTFSNLNYDTTYRVRAYAYGDAGTGNLISATDAGSYVDLAITKDDRPTLANLPVKLIDRTFDGQATASAIAVTPGTLTSAGTMSISQPLIVATLAGTAESLGSTDGTGTAAKFKNPSAVVADGSGNLYVADTFNHTIRKIVLSTGVVTTLAGTVGSSGSTNGTGTAAKFNSPYGLAADSSGNLYVADTLNHTIRKIVLSTGVVTTLAGTAGSSGSTDGTGSTARFNWPLGLVVDGTGNLYVADTYNQTIRKIVLSTGVVTTLAGTAGIGGSTNGIGAAATFDTPQGITFDGSANLYVTDFGSHTIRKVTTAGEVTTLAGMAGTSGSTDGSGSDAKFYYPMGLSADGSGNLYVADTYNHTIRKIVISTGVVTTLAGTAGSSGSTDGTGTVAKFKNPVAVVVDGSGNLFVADQANHTIRKIVP